MPLLIFTDDRNSTYLENLRFALDHDQISMNKAARYRPIVFGDASLKTLAEQLMGLGSDNFAIFCAARELMERSREYLEMKAPNHCGRCEWRGKVYPYRTSRYSGPF